MKIDTVRLSGGEMQYLSFGNGPRPLVILPGLSLRSVMLSAAVVTGGYALFTEEYSVTLFDRRTGLDVGYSIADMADDTAEAMKKLGIAEADVIGFSQGGMIAQLLAARYPSLVRKLVLGSTAPWVNPYFREVVDRWLGLAEQGNVRPLNRDMYQRIFSPATYEKYRKAFSVLEREGTQEELCRFRILTRAFDGFDAREELKTVRCPVLVLGAEEDRVLTGDASREIAELTGGELYMYEGYGHAVYDEAPDYKQRMLDFLRR